MVRQSVAIFLCTTIALSGCATMSARDQVSMRLTGARVTADQVMPSLSDPALMAEYVKKLPAGSRVRVETITGRAMRGTLIKASDESIVIQRNTRFPEPPEQIAVADLARVTLDAPSSNGKLMAIGAAIGAGAAIGVVWLIAVIAFAD